MLVANSFDLWQKDAFFSAAEEVQESADILESTYRTWLRERRENLLVDDLVQFTGELRTALGTAKWQLEEFEKAVRLSHGQHGDATKLARHSQFIDAIENQIFCVEASLREYFIKKGKQHLQWVSLDEKECDDLAAFLSGSTPTFQESISSFGKSPSETHCRRIEDSSNFTASCSQYTSDKVEEIKNEQYVVELEADEISLARNGAVCHTDCTSSARRIWSSPNIGVCKINIPDEDEQKNLLPAVEATPKEKRFRAISWKQRGWNFLPAKVAGHVCNQLLAKVLIQRQLHSPRYLQRGRSIQLTLALMLTIFLLVPFVLYSA